MKRYRWPGYEKRLLRELQRQQNSAQFCDTLLQTEGISVPTHSCVLAALSPYLSQKLSASPSPPSGQKRQLQLQAVEAKTLLKLVSLLYSGELEVKGGKEQNDVLAAAHQFGITHLVGGEEAGGTKEGALQEKRQSLGICNEEGGESQQSPKMRDAQVQAGRGDKSYPAKKTSCVSVGTQTVILSGQSQPAAPEPASSVAQSLDFSSTLQPQNITFDRHFFITPCPTIPSDEVSPCGQSSSRVTNPTSTSALSSYMVTFPISLNDDSSSPGAQEYSVCQEASASGDTIQVFAKGGTGLQDGGTNGKTSDNGGNADQVNRHEMLGEDNSAEKRHAHASAGAKSLSKMQQMVATTQISIKVKLRRRTNRGVWEVVSLQDTDETLSVLTPQVQNGSNHKTPQRELKEVQPPPSTVRLCPLQRPENLQAATATNPKPPKLPNTSSHFQPLSSGCFTPNQSNELESVLLPQSQGSVEESDEQMIERLLEDVMMGLNILPNFERDCKKPQPSHDRAPTLCQVPVTEEDAGQIHAVVSTAGCVYYQDLQTQGGHSSTDTGVHCFAAQNQPTFTSLSTTQPDALIQQQCSPQYDSSVTSLGQSEGVACPGMPSSKSQRSLCPEASTRSSVTPSVFFSSQQKLHYPAFPQPSSQEHQHILEFLPLPNGNETQYENTFSLPYMDDLQLPQCLSPLEAFTSTTKHQPLLHNSTNPGTDIQLPPSLPRRPWLTENPRSLQFPFNTITENKAQQDTSHSCRSMRWKERMGTCAESAAGLKRGPKKIKGSLKRNQDDTVGDAAAPTWRKRKRKTNPQDATSSVLVSKGSTVQDETKSFCSQRLSSSNELRKEREVTTGSSNMSCRLVGKPNEMVTNTESVREKTKRPGSLGTEWSRIRTRSVVKKSQEATTSKTAPENSYVLVPVVCRAEIVNMQGVSLPKRKRGRPRKKKLEDSIPAIVENKSNDVECELQNRKDLAKKEENERTKRGCKKCSRNKCEAIPLKKTVSAEADKNNDTITPKQPRMITLKDFQKLIKRQHSNITNESQETTEPDRDVESADRGRTSDKAAIETEMDVNMKERAKKEDHNVDKNHNQLFSSSAARYSKSHQNDLNNNKHLFGNKAHPVSSFDVEEETKTSTERGQTLKNPDGMLCSTGGSDALQSPISDEGSPHRETLLAQEHKMASDHNSHLQASKKTEGISRTSGCDQDEEEDQEEEEEEEVDILLYSPVPQSEECVDRLNNMDITPDEEEEEDMNEIDVTGDEAE